MKSARLSIMESGRRLAPGKGREVHPFRQGRARVGLAGQEMRGQRHDPHGVCESPMQPFPLHANGLEQYAEGMALMSGKPLARPCQGIHNPQVRCRFRGV